MDAHIEPKYHIKRTLKMKKLTTEQFVQRANLIHNSKYDYSLIDYKNSQTKIKIICPIHGIFEQNPNSHIQGKGQGCPICGNEVKGKARSAIAKSEFTAKASIIHNNKYDYSLVEYKNSYTKVKVICPIHGEFLQTANDHLSGKGCAKCAQFSTTEQFIAKAKSINGDRYDYSLVDYKSSKENVKIICKEHGIFETKPSTHLKHHQCPHCSAKLNIGWTRTSFVEKCDKNNNGLGILYVLECFNDNEHFYKIGITSRSIKRRYPSKTSMPYAYSVTKEIVWEPTYIYDLEIKLHQLNKENQYIPSVSFDGSLSECFSVYKEN